MDPICDFTNRGKRPHRVGGRRDCDQTRSVVQEVIQRIQIQRGIGSLDFNHLDFHTCISRRQNPRREVGIVV